jgi:maltooligosyltrehalose synthase
MKGAERLPLGEGVWGETNLTLPQSCAGRTFRNVFTKETVLENNGRLELVEVLKHFPVALLQA